MIIFPAILLQPSNDNLMIIGECSTKTPTPTLLEKRDHFIREEAESNKVTGKIELGREG